MAKGLGVRAKGKGGGTQAMAGFRLEPEPSVREGKDPTALSHLAVSAREG